MGPPVKALTHYADQDERKICLLLQEVKYYYIIGTPHSNTACARGKMLTSWKQRLVPYQLLPLISRTMLSGYQKACIVLIWAK
jgi:hypothetical protein